MGYYFCVNKKSLKERSLEHFGSSENKVLPRNKSFIEILSYEWKGKMKNKFSESIKKLYQFADVLVFKKALNMHHKTTLIGRK